MSEHGGTCVICTKGAAVGNLCMGHFDRFGSMLREVEDETALLTTVPSMQQRMDGGHGGLASERAPARLDVLVHLDYRRGTGKSETDDDAHAAGDTLPVLDVLHSWARIVREERGLTLEGSVTVMSERGLLTRHLDWIAAQGWADEAYTDVRTLLGQLKSANGTAPEKPVGRCYQIVADASCSGPVWVDEAHGHAHCGRCRYVWDGPAIARLKWELEEAKRPRTDDGRRMETADEIMRREKLTRSAFDVKAHRLRRAGQGGQSHNGYYDPDDFRSSMACPA